MNRTIVPRRRNAAWSALLLTMAVPAAADPATTSRLHWVTNGIVRAAAVDGQTLYVGGNFTRVAPLANFLGPWFGVSSMSGAALPRLPVADGPVYAIEPDGAGGYFVGGQFTRIGGVARTALARVLANGTIDPAFAPVLRPYMYAWPGAPNLADVRSLARSGTTLFAGGNFVITPATGLPRAGMAALDATTAGLLPWQGPAGLAAQRIILDGDRLLAAGVDARDAFGIASVASTDLIVGTVAWRRDLSFGRARDAALAGGRLLVAGTFVEPTGITSLVSLDPATGVVDTSWAPDRQGGPISQTSGLYAIGVIGSTAYVGGSISTFGGVPRANLAAVDISTGTVTSWAPQADGTVRDLLPAAAGTSLYVAGAFRRLAGATRDALAEIDTAGVVTAWTPQAHSADLWTLHPAGGTMMAGGTAAVDGGVARENLAAFALDTDDVRPWAPSVDYPVMELAASGGHVFAARPFSATLPASAARVAAFDGVSGAPAWTFPDATQTLFGAWDGHVYVWRTIGFRTEVSRLDAVSGAIDPSWRLDAMPTRLIPSGDRIYYLGNPFTLNGEFRTWLAVLDRRTGALGPWDPQNLFPSFPEGRPVVTAGALMGRTAYVSYTWSGTLVSSVVAADADSGAPVTSTQFYLALGALDLAAADGLLFAVGRPGHASVRPLQVATPNGTAVAWNPGLAITEPESWSDAQPRILVTDTDVVVTGMQNGDGAAPVQGVAVYARQPPVAPSTLEATSVDGTVRLSWTAAQPGVASHVVEAGSGPGLADILVQDTGSPLPALDAVAPPGTYFVRIRASGAAPGSREAEPTNEIALRVGCSAPPPPPTGLAASLNGVTVTLAWQAPAFASVARYVIEAGSGPGLANLARLAVTGTVTTFTTDAPPGTYYVRVRAEDACGGSAPSAEIWLTVGGGGLPAAPASLSISGTAAAYTVQWAAVPGATAYRVEAGTRPGLSDVASVAVAGPSLGPVAVTFGRVYYVRVRAVNGAGVGPPGTEFALIAR